MTGNEAARSFGAAVDAYDRGRPTYPDDAVDWLLAHAPRHDSAADERTRAVDLGAGTGKFTASLVARGLDVVAVEPDVSMLARLREHLPGVDAREGTAEAIPLPDASVDLVTMAQAWHWVDAERASAEVARVLAPGGVVALVWNIRDESEPWVRRLGEVAGSSPAERFETLRPPLGPALEHVASAAFDWSFELDREAVLAMFASRSYLIALPEEERAEVLAGVGRVVDEEFAEAEAITMPYATRVTIARHAS